MILFPIARHPFSTRDFFFPRSNNDVDREIELRDPAYRFEKKKEREREKRARSLKRNEQRGINKRKRLERIGANLRAFDGGNAGAK